MIAAVFLMLFVTEEREDGESEWKVRVKTEV